MDEIYGIERDDFEIRSSQLSDDSRIQVEEREDGSTVLKTRSVSNAISSHTPSFTNGSDLKDRVALGAPVVVSDNEAISLEEDNARLQGAADELEQVQEFLESDLPAERKALEFPNLAMEAVYAALSKERMTNQQIRSHIEDARRLQKDIDILLNLSASLAGHKDGAELSQETKDLLAQLKDRGIDLWKSGETKASKERISELKSLSGSQVDQMRSKLQIIFSTKIQVLTQTISAILEAVKDMIRSNSKVIEKANRLPGH